MNEIRDHRIQVHAAAGREPIAQPLGRLNRIALVPVDKRALHDLFATVGKCERF